MSWSTFQEGTDLKIDMQVATPPCTLLHLPDVPISPDLVNQADPGED